MGLWDCKTEREVVVPRRKYSCLARPTLTQFGGGRIVSGAFGRIGDLEYFLAHPIPACACLHLSHFPFFLSHTFRHSATSPSSRGKSTTPRNEQSHRTSLRNLPGSEVSVYAGCD